MLWFIFLYELFSLWMVSTNSIGDNSCRTPESCSGDLSIFIVWVCIAKLMWYRLGFFFSNLLFKKRIIRTQSPESSPIQTPVLHSCQHLFIVNGAGTGQCLHVSLVSYPSFVGYYWSGYYPEWSASKQLLLQEELCKENVSHIRVKG